MPELLVKMAERKLGAAAGRSTPGLVCGAGLAREHGPDAVVLPPRTTFHRLVTALDAGRHTFGAATTRRSLANRPSGPFGTLTAARPGEFAPKREGRLVAAQEAGDYQDRLSIQWPARAVLAERAEHSPEVPGDLAPIAVRRRRVISLPLVRGLGAVQRNSHPISCCIAAGSLTRPSAVW
jgi:hypothetical protein